MYILYIDIDLLTWASKGIYRDRGVYIIHEEVDIRCYLTKK